MKILEVFGEPISTGGQEMFVQNVITHLNKKNLNIDLLTPYYCDNNIYKDLMISEGVRIYSLGLPFNPGGIRFNLLKPLKSFLSKNHYDVVHIHSGSISVLAFVAYVARCCGVKKIVVHSHSAGEKNLKYFFIKMFSNPIMLFCPTIYCACSKIAGERKFPSRITKKQLKIVKNGVDLKKFSFDNLKRCEYREKYGIKPDEIVIGHIGRFSYVKNHVFLIEIIKQMIKRKINAKLVLIGSGELYQEIKEIVRNEILEKSVLFIGSVPNVNDYMHMMDVFVLPSHWEGLPIVGIEAQANGLPTIVSENVSYELDLTPSVIHISLTYIEKWCDTIIESAKKGRNNNYEVLCLQGYDINQTAEVVRNIYMS